MRSTSGIGTYLDEILAHKRIEVEERFEGVGVDELRRLMPARHGPSLFDALKRPGIQVIAEIKRRSPSKGELKSDIDPVALAGAFGEAGAAAVSVLTDGRFFGGSLADLEAVAESAAHNAGLVVLRKEFIIDRRQVMESAQAGADAILLIVAALSRDELADLVGATAEVGLEALVEVHDEAEIDSALDCGATIIGVNNRDLRSFDTDIATSERLLPMLPESVARVAESGLMTGADVRRVTEAGADAVLVGEALMKAETITDTMRELLSVSEGASR